MAGKTMHAVQYDSYGGGIAGLKHVKVPVPSPKKDEVLIKLEAASLHPADWKTQKGMMRPFLPPKFPFIPGFDVSGEVVEVNTFKPGDKVVAMLDAVNGGAFAEYAVAPVSLTVNRPPEVSAAEGAGLPGSGLTALQALKSIGVKFDGTPNPSNVLVTAASGGVGVFAVQLAKLGNTHVTATCGARNIDLVKRLGADDVLDYKTPEGASLRSPSGKTYDGVVHCTMGIDWKTFEPNLSTYGKVIDLDINPANVFKAALMKLPFLRTLMLAFSKKQLVPYLVIPNGNELKFLVELMKEGKLKTVIDSKHPLSKAEEAWAKSIDGHATGKIIIEM